MQVAKVIQTRAYSTRKPISNNKEPLDRSAKADNTASVDGVLNSSVKFNVKSDSKTSADRKRKSVKKVTLHEYLESRVTANVSNNKYYNLYKILGEKEYLGLCYDKIKSNSGNMPKDPKLENLDGFSLEKLEIISSEIMKGKYKFTPVIRRDIPKPNKPGKFRSISIGSPVEKLVQVGITEIIQVIYERYFLEVSHGFRPNRSVKTALYSLHKSGGPYV